MAERDNQQRRQNGQKSSAGKQKQTGGEDKFAEMERQAQLLQQAMSGDGKPLDANAIRQIAGKNASPETIRAIQEAQKAASGEGEMGMEQIAGMASMLGSQAGLSTEHQKFLNTLTTGFGKEVDTKEMGKIPGIVVDDETGALDVLGLGLFKLDPKDPTSKMIAQVLVAANTLVFLPLNAKLFEATYKGAYGGLDRLSPNVKNWSSNKINLTELSKHRIGFAAAAATTAATSFWPDINGFIRLEKRGKKNVMELAQEFAPVLDQYDNSNASRVSKLFRIRPEQNEMIYNECRRLHMEHNANRFRQTVEAVGRVPLYAVSVLRGREKLPDYQKAVKEETLTNQLADSDEARRQWDERVSKRADEIQQRRGINDRDRAVESAEKELLNPTGKHTQPEEKSKSWFGEFGRDAMNGVVLLAGPIMGMVAQNLYNQKRKEKGIQSVSAKDMVYHLRKQLNDNPRADRFSLPKGMSVQGSKNGNNQITLSQYIEQIFQQHEKDCNGEDARISARYDEQLDTVSNMIAESLAAGRLDGLALVRLVGERKIVREGGRNVAHESVVAQEIEKLENEMRHVEFVDNQRYFEESSFTPQELKEMWDIGDDERKAWMIDQVPTSVLEYAGIAPGEIKTVADKEKVSFEKDQQAFYERLANTVEAVTSVDQKTLELSGATRRELNLLEQVKTLVAEEGPDAIRTKMARDVGAINHAVVNTVMALGSEHRGKVISQAIEPRVP